MYYTCSVLEHHFSENQQVKPCLGNPVYIQSADLIISEKNQHIVLLIRHRDLCVSLTRRETGLCEGNCAINYNFGTVMKVLPGSGV